MRHPSPTGRDAKLFLFHGEGLRASCSRCSLPREERGLRAFVSVRPRLWHPQAGHRWPPSLSTPCPRHPASRQGSSWVRLCRPLPALILMVKHSPSFPPPGPSLCRPHPGQAAGLWPRTALPAASPAARPTCLPGLRFLPSPGGNFLDYGSIGQFMTQVQVLFIQRSPCHSFHLICLPAWSYCRSQRLPLPAEPPAGPRR